jgi:predicted RNase H-like HicB family nuclease
MGSTLTCRVYSFTDLNDMLVHVELIFEVRDAEEGGYCARALGHAIFTEADTWDELRENVREAATLHFEDSPKQPRLIQLHYVRDELIPVEAA